MQVWLTWRLCYPEAANATNLTAFAFSPTRSKDKKSIEPILDEIHILYIVLQHITRSASYKSMRITIYRYQS